MMNSLKKHLFQVALMLAVEAMLYCPLVASCVRAGSGENGHFYMVSVGVGDPDNITVRALNTIKKSDIVFCDGEIKTLFRDVLAGKKIYARPDHKITHYLVSLKSGFPVGSRTKAYSAGEIKQIRQEMADFEARVRNAVGGGKIVSFLENGDPAVYGPNIWIMEALAGVPAEIVPGISSFNAANAALKKGLTFGEKSKSAVLTNGWDLKKWYHGADTLEKLAATRSSLVFFTMHVDLALLVERLSRYYRPETPIAVVADAGYRKTQTVVHGTLDTILEIAEEKPISSRHLIYVGDFMADGIIPDETFKNIGNGIKTDG